LPKPWKRTNIKHKERGYGSGTADGRKRESSLTLKEHRLAEVTAHVIPTHGLDSEQVKAIG
jgi:hypothetical protein